MSHETSSRQPPPPGEYPPEHRWNVRAVGAEVEICRHNHDRNEPCVWERFVPGSELTRLTEMATRVETELVSGLLGKVASDIEGARRLFASISRDRLTHRGDAASVLAQLASLSAQITAMSAGPQRSGNDGGSSKGVNDG